MSDTWVKIRGRFELLGSDLHPVSDFAAQHVIDQVVRDSLYGTFDHLPQFWKDKWIVDPSRLAKVSEVRQSPSSSSHYDFEIWLASGSFPVDTGGIQHLIGVLAGDLFASRYGNYSLKTVAVDHVDMPDLEQRLSKTCAAAVRECFRLAQLEPLMAFSVKPRTGLRFEELEKVAREVLRSGFHLVELDTRNLNLVEEDVQNLLRLAKSAAELEYNGVVSHVTRFSPNLSVASDRAIELAERFRDVHQRGPWVIKIDGGLDGISATQAVMREFGKGGRRFSAVHGPPIITCYPLLRDILGTKVPATFFNRGLAASGVSVMYPGGRPDLGSAARQLGSAAPTSLLNAVNRYRSHIDNGYFMPTVAGGVHAGELHAYYELLGPNTAFFLGGAVALHKEGPVAGAKLCVRILESAIEFRANARSDDEPTLLREDLIEQLEASYGESGSLVRHAYICPRTLLATAQPFLTSWFADRPKA